MQAMKAHGGVTCYVRPLAPLALHTSAAVRSGESAAASRCIGGCLGTTAIMYTAQKVEYRTSSVNESMISQLERTDIAILLGAPQGCKHTKNETRRRVPLADIHRKTVVRLCLLSYLLCMNI